MKFYQLSVGQRFEFEGEVYVRTKPLIAVNEVSGQQRFIRRSATVKPLTQDAVATSGGVSADEPENLDRETVLDAFDAFYAFCAINFEEIGNALEIGRREKLLADLREERRRFLATVAR